MAILAKYMTVKSFGNCLSCGHKSLRYDLGDHNNEDGSGTSLQTGLLVRQRLRERD